MLLMAMKCVAVWMNGTVIHWLHPDHPPQAAIICSLDHVLDNPAGHAPHRHLLARASAARELVHRLSSGKSPSHIDGPLGVSPRSQKASVLERLNGMSLSTLGNLVCGIATPVDRGREAVEASTVGEWACRTGSGCHKIGRRQCKRAEGDAWPMHWGAGGGG